MHLSFGMFPEPGAHLLSIDFTGCGLGDLGRKFDRFWSLYSAQLLFAMGNNGCLARGYARTKHNECLDCLSPCVMWNANHRTLVNLRQRHHCRFHFGAVNIKSAGDDHVFLSVHDVDVTFFAQVTDITGVVLAVPADFRRGLRQLVIAATD